jgi:murein L,D-transpeptidase YcbB/YkuD
MLRRSASAGFAAALALTVFAAGPARAQMAASADPPAAEPAPTPAATPAPAPVDPLLAEVRKRVAEIRGGERADSAALTAFYADRSGPLLWVTEQGLTARASHAMAEIAKADDWGLPAAAFDLPQLGAGETSPAALAAAEIKLGLAVLKYARHARGGRIDPMQISRNIDQKPPLRDPKDVLAAVAATESPGDYLQGLHPKHEQFVRLRQALLKVRAGVAPRPEAVVEPTVRLPNGPVLKPGMQHPDVALLRQRLKVPAEAGQESVYDPALAEAVKAFQRDNKMGPDGVVGGRTRTVLNGGPAEPKAALAGTETQRLLLNMERWRWMPETLGDVHIWDNIPEYVTRVFKKGQQIHSAKIIVGKVETQTVIFSANMRYIVFHPEWGVPDSIKVKELAPYLRPSSGDFFGMFGGADTRVLQKHNLRVSYNGKPIDASSVNWGQVDVRRFSFIQPAGPTNVLGVVKFRFPNKHDIYMHDTPQRELFDKTTRTFSHGCIRVHNPGRLAEILLAEDKGWSAEHVRGLLARGNNNEVTLEKQIPVHVAYFTAVVGDDGHVSHFGDIYGHDNRLQAALSGRPLPLEAPSAGEVTADAKRPAKSYKQTNSNDFFSGLFGN